MTHCCRDGPYVCVCCDCQDTPDAGTNSMLVVHLMPIAPPPHAEVVQSWGDCGSLLTQDPIFSIEMELQV